MAPVLLVLVLALIGGASLGVIGAAVYASRSDRGVPSPVGTVFALWPLGALALSGLSRRLSGRRRSTSRTPRPAR